jgi:hypothetical protein
MTTLYPLASLSQIEATPSREDGIPHDLEEDLRAYGCKLIHQAGVLLKQYVFTIEFLQQTQLFMTGSRLRSRQLRFYSNDSGLLLP